MKKVKTKLVLILTLLGLYLFSNAVFAQTYSLSNLDIRMADGSETIQINGLPGASFQKQLLIKNYSADTATLTLSTTDAQMLDGKFTLSTSTDNFNYAADWIQLSQNNIVLRSGESQLVDFQINYPEKAGVGKHFAGIMVRQNTKDSAGNLINFETGIRIYADVTGKENQKFKLINPRTTETHDTINYSVTVLNSGNTNLSGLASLMNQASNAVNNNSDKLFLQPGEDQKIHLTIPKNTFGPQRITSNISIGDTTKTFLLSDTFNIPSEILILLGMIVFVLTALTMLRKADKKSSIGRNYSEITVFSSIMVASLIMSLNLNNLPLALTQTDLIGGEQQSAYLVTVKWGNLTNQSLPDWVKTNWEGHLQLTDGEMFMVEKLHNESEDQFYLNNTGDSLNFKNTTGPDNDGVIILIKPASTNSIPVLTIHNILTGEEIPVIISSTLETPRYINYKQHQIKISSEPAPDVITIKTETENISVSTGDLGQKTDVSTTVTEIQGSPDNSILDLEATPDETTIPVTTESSRTEIVPSIDNAIQIAEEINLLKSLITEIPSSPDVISQYVLNSSHVEEVSSENNTTTVKSSPILIDTLKDTPLTIQELTSTPDLNYIFLPNEKVKLASQSFSFTEGKISSQELNEIVFVQRKEVPWTVYLSITNLVSVSGNGSIATENISVNPGKVYISNQSGAPSSIEAGPERRFFHLDDQIMLTSITPTGEGETTFSIRPKLSVSIPPNTPPGLYRGTISIKVI